MTFAQEKMNFALAMGRETGAGAAELNRLLRYAATLSHLALKHCNGPWGEDDEEKLKHIQHKVQLVLQATPGVTGAVFSDDPMAHALKIKVASGYTNDFDNEGIIVPVIPF